MRASLILQYDCGNRQALLDLTSHLRSINRRERRLGVACLEPGLERKLERSRINNHVMLVISGPAWTLLFPAGYSNLVPTTRSQGVGQEDSTSARSEAAYCQRKSQWLW